VTGAPTQADLRGNLGIRAQDGHIVDDQCEDLLTLSINNRRIGPKLRQILRQCQNATTRVYTKLFLSSLSEASEFCFGGSQLGQACIPLRLEAGRDQTIRRVDEHEAPPRRVKVEQLGIAAPGDSRLHLAQAFLFAELLIEHVEEELLGNRVVALGVERAANLAQQQHVGDGGVAGIFTDGDLRRLIETGADLRGLAASEVMHTGPKLIRGEALAVEAAALMERHRVTGLLVVDAEGRLVGALNSNDLMRAKVI